MLLRKDIEIIFNNPEIQADLAEIEHLYHKRLHVSGPKSKILNLAICTKNLSIFMQIAD